MEYYQKLKESLKNKSTKGTQRTSRTDSKRPRGSELLDISLTSSQRRGPGVDYAPHISLKHSSMGSDSEANTPAHPSQTSQRSKIKTKRSGSTAFDIANREKSLFFSPLAKTLELNRFSVSFNQGHQQQPETPASPVAKVLATGPNEEEEEEREGEGEGEEEAGTPKAIVKRMTRKQIQKEQQSWIVKTNDIKQGINDYLADKKLGVR